MKEINVFLVLEARCSSETVYPRIQRLQRCSFKMAGYSAITPSPSNAHGFLGDNEAVLLTYQTVGLHVSDYRVGSPLACLGAKRAAFEPSSGSCAEPKASSRAL